MSQSRLFEHDVFLVDYLDNESRQVQKSLNCVCLLRPTSKNADLIASEIIQPKYQSYHLSKRKTFFKKSRVKLVFSIYKCSQTRSFGADS